MRIYKLRQLIEKIFKNSRITIYYYDLETGGNPTSKTSAHRISDTVATFRSWRGFQSTIAKPPAGLPLQDQSIEIFYILSSQTLSFSQVIHSFAYFIINISKKLTQSQLEAPFF